VTVFPQNEVAAMMPVNANPDTSLIETSPHDFAIDKLYKQGILLVKGVFSGADVVALRRKAEAVARRAFLDNWHVPTHLKHPKGRTFLGDLLGMEELSDWDHVVFQPRVISYAKQLLGEDIVYFGDSCIRWGNGGRGFHRDFVDDTPPTAGMVRFALYLQDHARHSGGLKVRLRSHRYTSRHFGTMMNVYSEPGDLVLFYLRTAHTGNNVRLRNLPGWCLHPKLESLVPHSLRLPEEQERLCLLWTFGRPGSSLDRYVAWISRFPEYWKYHCWNQKLLDLAGRRGVAVRKVTRDQGVLLAPSPDLCELGPPQDFR
jgi:hypothetical protein